MELKNAVAVCLISIFSATLVVLIARSLDSLAASQLEPQLAQIVEELRAIRTQGGITTVSGYPCRTCLLPLFPRAIPRPTCRYRNNYVFV